MPARKRHDPPVRNDVSQWDSTLLNLDPEREYRFVDPNSEAHGFPMYEARYGAVLEQVREGGPRLANGVRQKEGVVKFQGQVLCSFPREAWADEVAEGQRQIDEIEHRIRGGKMEEIRGLGARIDHHQSMER